MDILDVLNRRSDLSTFVVHFTREFGGRTASANLSSILTSCKIEARNARGWIGGVPTDQLSNSRVVCFSETPLEHAYSLVQQISGRAASLSPYGLAFTKAVARLKGVNPIWYVDMTPDQEARWAIKEALDSLKQAALDSKSGFADHPAARVLPFIEQMGTWPSRQKEFWWEREWRHRGDFSFAWGDVTLVFCPEPEIEAFELCGWPAVDPAWSLERMIERLARANVGARQERRRNRRELLNGLDDEASEVASRPGDNTGAGEDVRPPRGRVPGRAQG